MHHYKVFGDQEMENCFCMWVQRTIYSREYRDTERLINLLGRKWIIQRLIQVDYTKG